MHSIYLGYSSVLSAEELIQYFDIDAEHETGKSKFEQNFGCGYIEPGSFEVYESKLYGKSHFDGELIEKLLPFKPDHNLISEIDFSRVKSFFYIKLEKVLRKYNDSIVLVGPMFIKKFDFES